jgi:hypothetical protein
MLKKEIKYTDYNDVERIETFYFNLTKAECLMLETSMNGGLSQYISRIVDSQDIKSIVEIFTKIIELSYGEKSPDGKRFIKTKELTDSFIQSPAYSELYVEMISNEKEFANFINSVVGIPNTQQITINKE